MLGMQNEKASERTSRAAMADAPHFYELVRILHRRAWLILAIATFGTALAAIIALLIPPKYTATAQLAVEFPSDLVTEQTASPALIEERVETHVTLLSSRDHLQRVARALSELPEFGMSGRRTRNDTGPAASRAPLQSGGSAERSVSAAAENRQGLIDRLWRHLDVWMGSLRRPQEDGTASLAVLERNVAVVQERRSRVITVAVTSVDPRKAAAIANCIVELYVDRESERLRSDASDEMRRLQERLVALKDQAQKAEAAVQKAAEWRHDTARNSPRSRQEMEADFRALEHEAAVSALVYRNLLRRQEKLLAQQENLKPGIRILSRASVPEWPSSHNPLLFIVPALIIFTFAGSVAAVARERWDRGLRSEREIREAFNVSCLGLVPALPRWGRVRPHEYLLQRPSSAYAQAIWSAVAALDLAKAMRCPKVVLISSSVPGEGKTTLAVSVAAGAAAIGKRVLLIDFGRSRASPRGALDRRVEDENVTSGRIDGAFTERIRSVPELRLDYLPVPQDPSNPLAPFAHDAVSRMLQDLRRRYDCIIIDGPPLLGAAETRLLAAAADKLLFVVKWARTRRELVQSALQMLPRGKCGRGKAAGDRLIAIVTQVHLKKHIRYGYGDVAETLARYRTFGLPCSSLVRPRSANSLRKSNGAQVLQPGPGLIAAAVEEGAPRIGPTGRHNGSTDGRVPA